MEHGARSMEQGARSDFPPREAKPFTRSSCLPRRSFGGGGSEVEGSLTISSYSYSG